MRKAVRSQLRTVLLTWAAAWLTFVVGYCAAIAIFIFGIYEGVKALSSNAPLSASVGPMVLGCGLQLLLVVLFVAIRDRFEHRCWQLIAAEAGTLVSNGASTQVLAKQSEGEDNHLADVRARQSRHLSKRLGAIIEQAWPDRADS